VTACPRKVGEDSWRWRQREGIKRLLTEHATDIEAPEANVTPTEQSAQSVQEEKAARTWAWVIINIPHIITAAADYNTRALAIDGLQIGCRMC
jgi:hypothetical protein